MLYSSVNKKFKLLCTLAILWFCTGGWNAIAAEYQHEIVDCAFEKKDWTKHTDVQCLQLIINEAGQSESFTLPVVLLKNKQGIDDNAPIIFLQGGPGGIGIGPSEAVESWYNRPMRENHDILLIDFRGTGKAQPEICPDISMDTLRSLAQDLSPQEEITQRVGHAKACFESLPFTGDIPALFTSRKSAEDINALREILAYEKLNIYSVSYGTKVAMAYAEAFPDKLAGLVLDSVVPPDYGYYQDIPVNFEKSLERLFSDCEKSAECNVRFPNFRQDFYKVLEDLNNEPLRIALLNKDIAEKGELVVNPQDFLIIFRQLMYGRDVLPVLPLLIDELRNGNVEPLALLFDLILANQARMLNFATYYMVLGKEELSVSGGDIFHQQIQTGDTFPGLTLFEADFALYEQSRTFFGEPEPKINATVTAPTLVLAGSYDPMTIPAYGKQVADNIPGSYFVEFHSVGHAPFFDDACAESVVEEFFKDNQQPKFDCVDEQKPVPFITGLILNDGLFDLVSNIRYKKNKLPLYTILAMALMYFLALLWCLWRVLTSLFRGKNARSRFNNDSKANMLFFSGLFLGLAVPAVLAWTFAQGVEVYGFISVLFGLPPHAWSMIPALILLMVVTILMIPYAKNAWLNKKWKLSGRIYFAVVLLTNAWLFGFLVRWGLF